MFRKYYKEANNDIKPDEAFVMSVIENAKKPPVHRQYMKYVTAAAAAVAVVSAAVISMPVWQRVDDNEVIVDNVITETAAPSKSTPAPVPVENSTIENNEGASETPQTDSKPAGVPHAERGTDTGKHSYSPPQGGGNTTPAEPEPPVNEEKPPEENTQPSQLESEVQDSADYELKAARVPDESEIESFDASSVMSAKMAAIPDSDIPAPAGYYCTSAAPDGYTFVNDDGAVIVVKISYGGEESDVYISEDGDNIYASFTSFGMKVTVNASGADRTTVEEIIYSLR